MKRKRWTAGILSAAVAASAAAGIWAGVNAGGGRPVMVVSAGELNQGFYDGGVNAIQAVVTEEASQNVYLQDTERVARVLVKEGDLVREGDILMEYDTAQTRLNLEKEKLSREQISLSIRAAEENIKNLKQTKPVPEDGEADPGTAVWEELPEEEIPLDPEISPEPEAAPESEETPDPGREFLVKLEGNQEGGSPFPEIRVSSGKSLRSYLDALPEEEWKQYVPSAEGLVFGGWYEDRDCRVPYDLDAPVENDLTLYARWHRQYQAEAAGELTGDAKPYNLPGRGEPEAGTLLNPYRYLASDKAVVYPSFMNKMKEKAAEALKENPDAHLYFALEVYQGDTLGGRLKGFYLQDAAKLAGQTFPDNWRGTLLAETGSLEVSYLSREEFSFRGTAAVSMRKLRKPDGEDLRSELLPQGGTYTEEELKAALKEQEEKLEELKLDLKEADLKIRSAEKAAGEGAVRAKISGIVKKAGDPGNPPKDGSAFLQVSGTEGMYLRGGLSELMLGQVQEGDLVEVMAWESGTSCLAEIREISPYPDESGMFSGYYGLASASFYPFTAYVAEGGETLISQEWAELSPVTDSGGTGGKAEELYLWKAFILEENGKQYVFLRGENGRLKKQEIRTGRRFSESCQVLSGVSWEDWLAFPYGKEIRSGAKTREGSLAELYGN